MALVARPDLLASFFGGPGFTLYHAWGPHGRVPQSPHFHDEYLICAQLRGHEQCRVGGRTLEFHAGDVVLINPHQVHTGNAEGEEVEYVSLYVDRDTVRRFAAELGAPTDSPEFTLVRADQRRDLAEELLRLLLLVREQTGGPLYPLPSAPPEDDVTLPNPDEGAPEAAPRLDLAGLDLTVEDALLRVLHRAFEDFSNLRQPRLRSSNRVGHRKIAKAVAYIRDMGEETDLGQVSLDDLADIAGLSKYHFLRQFDRVVGMTPGAYLRTLRLCHAARMLRTSTKPILQIAQSVGFADHPSFSRAFARHMGMTPSEYRRLGPL